MRDKGFQREKWSWWQSNLQCVSRRPVVIFDEEMDLLLISCAIALETPRTLQHKNLPVEGYYIQSPWKKNCRSKINMLELSPKRKELTIHTVEQSWTWQSHIALYVYHLLTGRVLSVLICLVQYVNLSSHTPCRSKDCWVNQLLCKTGLLYIPGLYVCCDVCALTLKVLTVPMQTKLHLWILRSSYLC